MEKWWVIKPIPSFLPSFTACLRGPEPEPVPTVNLGCSGNISTYVYGWYTSSSPQVSWRKLMSLKELNLKTRSSWGFGMFLLELPRASGTVGCLCTDLDHWQKAQVGAAAASREWEGFPGLGGAQEQQGWKDLPLSHAQTMVSIFWATFPKAFLKITLVDSFKIICSFYIWTIDTGVPFLYRSVSLTHLHTYKDTHKSVWWANHTKNKYSHFSKLFIELILF